MEVTLEKLCYEQKIIKVKECQTQERVKYGGFEAQSNKQKGNGSWFLTFHSPKIYLEVILEVT